jgi:hypothetical protein
MWHMDPLLSNDRKKNNETRATATQPFLNKQEYWSRCYTRQNRRSYSTPQDIWDHRRGYISKIELIDGSAVVSQAILESPEDDQC